MQGRCTAIALLMGLWWTVPALAEGFLCAGSQGTPTEATPPSGVASKPVRITQSSTTGTRRALVLFARFKGEPTNPVPSWAADVFNPELPGSFSHFYDTTSFGKLQVRGEVSSRVYESAQPASAYLAASPSEQGRFGQFAQEILLQADQDLDFAQFDNDGPDGVPNSGDDDGVVDAVFIVLERIPANFLLSEATGISRLGFSGSFTSNDIGAGKALVKVFPEQGTIEQGRFFAEAVGAMCHEYGHVLGLPDLYDMDYSKPAEDSAGLGRWCLMGWGTSGWQGNDGPNAFCAWSLEQLGWIGEHNTRLVEVKRDTALVARGLRQGGAVYKIPLVPRTEGKPAEYLLLEQRTRSGSYYDRHLPGEGLLLWHIRAHQNGQYNEQNKQVDLVCADGLYQDAGYPQGKAENKEQGGDNLDFWAHDEGYSQAHGGNLGDATDPFDGVRWTHFDLETNPSSSLQGLFPSEASKPLELRFQAVGEAMQVVVRQPRWAGKITQQAHWAGQVIVDGDLQVAPGGSLSIAPGTQVLLEGADRLQAGRDPQRIEVEIQGSLTLSSSAKEALPSVFQALHPGERWYGLIFAPTDSSVVSVAEDNLVLNDAERGVEFPGGHAEQGVVGKAWIDDDPNRGIAGNGDGKLSPGETFQIVVELDNYSLNSYSQVLVQAYWGTELITGGNEGYKVIYTYLGALYPGQQRQLSLPVLGVDAQAKAGQQLELTVGAFNSFFPWQTVWQDSLLAEVVLTYPEHTAQYILPGASTQNRSVYLPLGKTTPIQVRLQGEIASADLVIHPQAPLADSTWELPLQLQEEEGGSKLLSASWQPPELGLYHCELRLHTPQGGVALSPQDLYIWAAPAEGEWPVLAFVEYYDRPRLEAIEKGLREQVGNRGLGVFILGVPADSALYAALLPHYAAHQGMVLWMGLGSLDAGTLRVFRHFLDDGGRLGIISTSLLYYRNTWDMLSIKQIIPPRGGGLKRFRSLSDPVSGYADDFNRLEIAPPAKPLLVDDEGRPTGLYVEKGRGRLVYIASHMGLMYQFDPIYYVQTSLAYLQGGEQEATLSLTGHEQEGVVYLPDHTAPRVRVVAGEEVGEVTVFVRSISGTDSLLEVPLPRLGEEGDRQSFGGDLESLTVGHYQLLARLRDRAGRTLFSTTSLQIVVPGNEGEVLLVMDKTISDRGKKRLVAAADSLLSGAGLRTATAIIEGTEDAAFYEALLANHQVVLWMGQTLGRESQEVFLRFLERGGRLLLASSLLHSSGGAEDFLREAVHVAGVDNQRADGQVGMVIAQRDSAAHFPLSYFPLELEAPAVPLLQGGEGQVAGAVLVAGDHRVVYLPFELSRVTTALPALLGNVLELFLQPREVKLWAGGAAAESGYRMAARPPVSLPVYLYAQEEITGAELLLCRRLQLQQVSVLPMSPSLDTPSEWVAALPLTERDQYLLLARLKDAQGRIFLSPQSFQLDAVLFAQPKPAVVFASGDDSTSIDIEQALAGEGLEADVVEYRLWDSGLYEYILKDYPGGLAIWIRGSLDQRGQAALRNYTEHGGSLLIASMGLASAPGIEPFLSEVLHVGLGGDLAYDFLRSGLPLGFLRVYTPLVSRLPAVPVVWDLKGQTAGVQVDAGAYRAVYLSFGLEQMNSDIRRPLLEKSLEFLRPSLVSLVEEGFPVPTRFSLSPNFPNPFNPTTTLRFSLPQPGEAELAIYNLLGQRVATLMHGVQEAGVQMLQWDGRDDQGRELASGVYLYRLQAGSQVETRKLLLLR